jgi:hypothetical protein
MELESGQGVCGLMVAGNYSWFGIRSSTLQNLFRQAGVQRRQRVPVSIRNCPPGATKT